MATLDQRGLVNDGSPNLSVTGLMATGATTMLTNTLPGSGSFGAAPLTVGGIAGLIAVPGPGFYSVPVSGSSTQGAAGVGTFTGSLPTPSQYPGGSILITDSKGQWAYMLTGTIVLASGSGGTAPWVMSSQQGTHLVVSAGGTVGLWSDSKGWLVCAVSGTLTLSA